MADILKLMFPRFHHIVSTTWQKDSRTVGCKIIPAEDKYVLECACGSLQLGVARQTIEEKFNADDYERFDNFALAAARCFPIMKHHCCLVETNDD